MEYPTFLYPRLHHDDRHDEFVDVVVERVNETQAQPATLGPRVLP